MTDTDDRLINVKRTAEMLGCSAATVWRMLSEDRIPQPVKIGGMTRWSEKEIFAFIEAAKAARA